jgi:hypothetical protein
MRKTIKIVRHESGKTVVNMPGTGMKPRVYRSAERALAKVAELMRD